MGMMFILGFNGFNALSLNVIGFQYGNATRVAWLEYTSIIFSFLFQTFLFRDPLDQFEVIGCILVAMGCSLSVFEEVYVHYADTRSDGVHPIVRWMTCRPVEDPVGIDDL